MVVNSLEGICVAGITPFTTIDFPGRLAGVFYLQGCPWRCRYCYNSEFWPLVTQIPPALQEVKAPVPTRGSGVPLEKILEFLNARKGHLEGIVFSGGEPTIHKNLPLWMRAVREFGFEIGLHTGGLVPERFAEILPLCDWVGMDIKAPFGLYEKVTQVAGSGVAARRSAELLLASGVSYEFRTTFHAGLLSEEDVLEMARELVALGGKNYVLQMFRAEHCPDKELRESHALSAGISANLRQTLKPLFQSFQVRE